MCAATVIGIIGEERVARTYVIDRVALEYMFDCAQHRAEMHGNVLGLGDQPTLGIKDRSRGVVSFLDVGGIGRTDQQSSHLFSDGHKRVGKDLQQNGIRKRGDLS